jgi:hypothetical protein
MAAWASQLEGLARTYITPQFLESFQAILKIVKEAYPPNWPSGLTIEAAVQIITEEGIPLTYVPRAEIVSKMLEASDRRARVTVLLNHSEAVLDDCTLALSEVESQDLAEYVDLTGKAVGAYRGGHVEAAQTLAVVVAESVIYEAFGKYSTAIQRSQFVISTVQLWELRLRTAIAPIAAFYTPYFKHKGDSLPEITSRHATVHHPSQQTLTAGDSLIATLFAVSLLRALDEAQQHAT